MNRKNSSSPAIDCIPTATTTTPTDASPNPSAEEICVFLSRYAARLQACGATCIRVEKNLRRMARALGVEVEIVIMPRHIHMSLLSADGRENITTIAPVPHAPISFNVNTRLSELSWELADRRIDFHGARQKFRDIISTDTQSTIWVLLAVTVANASFCRLFGGDFIAMLTVAAATFAGYFVKQTLIERGLDIRVTVLICAFVSAVLGASDGLFHIGSTPGVALGSSVLYLVPGIPFLNSFSDMIYRRYLCAMSRFIDAVVLTACLSVGLFAGIMLMHSSFTAL